MSNITIQCPHCQQKLEADDRLLGRYSDCPSCGKRFRISIEPENKTGLSMTTPLVFQSIAVGYALIETLCVVGEADEDTIGTLAILAIVPLILTLIFTARFHYKCWKAVPAGFARLTPGKAVGYLFIPFFNLYWSFPSFHGLAQDCSVVAKDKGLRGFSSLPALGLTYAILFTVNLLTSNVPILSLFVGVAQFVMWILLYRSVLGVLNGRSNTQTDPQPIKI
jgi:hypothetical protein